MLFLLPAWSSVLYQRSTRVERKSILAKQSSTFHCLRYSRVSSLKYIIMRRRCMPIAIGGEGRQIFEGMIREVFSNLNTVPKAAPTVLMTDSRISSSRMTAPAPGSKALMTAVEVCGRVKADVACASSSCSLSSAYTIYHFAQGCVIDGQLIALFMTRPARAKKASILHLGLGCQNYFKKLSRQSCLVTSRQLSDMIMQALALN